MSAIFSYGIAMRASRLLSMLILLQLRGRLTAAALAQEFEVSIRTVYRDVDALSAAGVPIYADRGPGGGFALLDGWRMRLTGLSGDEAEALALAGLPGPARALGIGGAAGAAANKLRAALPADAGARAGRVAARIHFDFIDWYRAADDLPHLPLLMRAVLDERCVAMRYDSWTAIRDWQVAPLGLVMKGGHWYLVAEGQRRTRIFRVSNIADLRIVDAIVQRPADFDLADWWSCEAARFESELRPMTIRIKVRDDARLRLRDTGAHAAAALRAGRPEDGWTAVELPVENLDQAARLVLGLGDGTEAITPELRALVAEMAAAAARLHTALPRAHPAL